MDNNSEYRLRFVDNKGTPVSFEAVESDGFTNKMELEGQGIIYIKLKKGVLGSAFRCSNLEEFKQFATVLFGEIDRENSRS